MPVCATVSMCLPHMHMEGKRELSGVQSLVLPCRFQGFNLGQALWHVPLPTAPSHQNSRLITLGVHLYPLSCLIFHIAILYFTEFYKFFKILQNYHCWGRCVAQMRHTKQDGLMQPGKPISRTLVCIWCYHRSYRDIQVPQSVI